MLILLFAAHQGEEFVIILPAIMFFGAYFIMKWAGKPLPDQESADTGTSETRQSPDIPEIEDIAEAEEKHEKQYSDGIPEIEDLAESEEEQAELAARR